MRETFDAELANAIGAMQPDWIVCAGYMRILGDDFVRRFSGKLLNIHPSLLPRYKGLRTHARALQAGDAEHGASVHFVAPELDGGAVIAQTRIAIEPGDTPETLAKRLLSCEHALYLSALKLAVAGRLAERNGVAWLDNQPLFKPLLADSSGQFTPFSTTP
jgi:phosphoribosylglycinamide formyltransferase-1